MDQKEYNDYFNDQLRMPQMDRDKAILHTNVHFGYGNSTAAKFPVTDEKRPPYVKPPKPEEK